MSSKTVVGSFEAPGYILLAGNSVSAPEGGCIQKHFFSSQTKFTKRKLLKNIISRNMVVNRPWKNGRNLDDQWSLEFVLYRICFTQVHVSFRTSLGYGYLKPVFWIIRRTPIWSHSYLSHPIYWRHFRILRFVVLFFHYVYRCCYQIVPCYTIISDVIATLRLAPTEGVVVSITVNIH